MNNLQVFNNEEFGQVRTIEENGKILFGGTDVARALGYTQPHKAVNRHCKKDGGIIRTVIDNLGRKQDTKFINEGNLYRLIINSKLPSAEKFENWVFDEVLPTIRKTGSYGAEQMEFDQRFYTEDIRSFITTVSTEIIKGLIPVIKESVVRENKIKNSKGDCYKYARYKFMKLPKWLRLEAVEIIEEMEEDQALNLAYIARYCTEKGYKISANAVIKYYDDVLKNRSA